MQRFTQALPDGLPPASYVTALRAAGHADIADHHLPDDLPRLESALGDLLATHEVLVLSGGVSMGQFDHVPAALRSIGVHQVLHRIAQRQHLGRLLALAGLGPAVSIFGSARTPADAPEYASAEQLAGKLVEASKLESTKADLSRMYIADTLRIKASQGYLERATPTMISATAPSTILSTRYRSERPDIIDTAASGSWAAGTWTGDYTLPAEADGLYEQVRFDVLYVNGRFHTQDPARPFATTGSPRLTESWFC